MGPEEMKAAADELIAYHGAITRAMTAERTALESKLIPVTAYIVVAAGEAFSRWPDMVRTIDSAVPAEKIGLAGRRPGSLINPVNLWSAANIYLTGRKFMTGMQIAPDPVEPTWRVLDFWERAATAYRGDGHRQAWDAGLAVRPYDDEIVATLVDGAVPVGDDEARTRITRFSATVMAYLFLLYFDTRVGTGDTGPYPLPHGRVLLVRDFYQLGRSHFWWSDVAEDLPYQNLTAALVLDGVDLRVNDWGTSLTEPEDYLRRLVAFGLFTTDTPDQSLSPVPLSELDAIVAAVRKAQSAHYRNVAAMSRSEKVRCGAYVYFTFLRPFAEVAGVADDLDWTVPRDITGPLYDMIEAIDGGNATEDDTSTPYYPPLS